MLKGMLWFDDSQTALLTKIQKACAYYQKRYGVYPNLAMVHPCMLKSEEQFDQKITIEDHTLTLKPYRPVLPGHIWIGIAEETEIENQNLTPESQ